MNDTTGFVDLKMDPSNPEVLYAAAWHRIRWGGGRMEGAGEGSGICKTTDGGATLDAADRPGAATTGSRAGHSGRIGLGVSPERPAHRVRGDPGRPRRR